MNADCLTEIQRVKIGMSRFFFLYAGNKLLFYFEKIQITQIVIFTFQKLFDITDQELPHEAIH